MSYQEWQPCKTCGQQPKRKRYVFCSNSCQATFQYRQFISLWIEGKVDGGRIGGVSYHIRRYLSETYGECCSICGWNITNQVSGKVPLDIDHIDGNYLNNSPENVRLLCPNCHSLTSTYKGLNKGNGRTKRTLASLVQRSVQ